ncbi:MAG TPA: autotransporter-associated beta strand repeat-containing protein [Phycisphaerae bacterium]|nr:autotransporter-associated beta strand repeat-containing protein [Phycisphaerae bacterium]
MVSSPTRRRQSARVRGAHQCLVAAIASAGVLSFGASQSLAATTYNYVFPGTAGSNVDWATSSAWTTTGTPNAVAYPGGDPLFVDDVASISFINTTAALNTSVIGANVITLSSPLASTLSSMSLIDEAATNNDTLTLNLNANLTVTGGVTVTGGTGTSNSTPVVSRGLTFLNTAANTTFTVGGTFSVGGSNSFGNSNVTINGNASFGNLTLRTDGSTIVVSSTAGNVALGNVNLSRSANNGTATSAGLHLLDGTITAGNFVVGSADSSAIVEINNAANLSISGTFLVGDNSAASARNSTVFQNNGTVSAPGSTLVLGTSAVGTSGRYLLAGGSLSVGGIQLTNVGGNASNKANFTLSNNATVTIGSGGIATGSGTYTLASSGGTIAAAASWATTANMALTNTTTFRSADGSSNPFDITLNGSLSGTGTIIKTGGGNLTLGGNNSYSGNTTVSAGSLFVNNTAGSGTGTGSVTVNTATLGGSGTITGDVTINSGSHLAPGNNNVGTLNLGNVTLASGSILDFDFNTAANSLANLTGSLTINGGGINLYTEGTTNAFDTNGTYNLFQFAGSVPGNFNTLQILNGVAGVTYTLGSTAHDITLTISGGSGGVGWAVDAGGSWGTSSNWSGGIPSGNTAVFPNVLSAPRTVTLDGSRTVTGLSFNSPFGYTVAQGSGGSLILDNGSGNVSVTDFAGPHTISAPVVLNSTTNITTTNMADTLTFSGVVSGAGNVSVSGSGTVIISGNANTLSGTITNSGNLQIGSGAAAGSLGTASVVNSGTLLFNSSSPMTLSNTISGVGNITQNGSGIVTLSGNNTYTGTTNINAGIIRYGTTTALNSGNVNIGAAGKLDINGLAVTVFGLTGSGIVDNMLAASNATLTFGGANPSFSGTIQSTGGNLTVVSSVTGRLTLSGNNTYSGGTNVTSGTVGVGSNNALGTGNVTVTSTTANTLVLSAGVVVPNTILINDGSIEFADIATAGTSATFAGPISTVGSTQYRLGNSNTGTLIMTGPSTVGTGITLFTRGNIVFAGNGSLSVTSQPVTIGRSSATSNVNVTVQDNAFLRGAGINLGGLNSSSDDLSANITLNNNALLDAGTNVFSLNNSCTTGTSVTLIQNGNSTVRGASFAMTGSKATGGSPTATTLWQINGGNIVATANNTNFMPASSQLTIFLAGPLTINDGGFNITMAAPFTDFGGSVTKTGTGSLALTAAGNAYSGGTTVNAGTLFANAAGATGSGAVVVGANGTLGGNASIPSAVTVSGHLAPGFGAATGTLALSSGATLNSGSTLDINLKADGSANSVLEIAGGSLTNSGAGLDLYQAGTTFPFEVNGTYKLIQFDGGFVSPGFSSVANAVAGVNYVFSNDANNFFVTISNGLTSAQWAVDADGSWTAGGSWTGGIPNQVSGIANFGSMITAPHAVSLDGTKTAGIINFSNANAYTINQGSGGNLILDNGIYGSAQINDNLGSHTINAPVTLNSNTTVTVTNSTDTLSISSAIGGTGALTFQGAGKLALGGANSFASLTAAGTGSVIVTGANTYSGATTISSGTIQLGAGGTLGNGLSPLSIASGATLDLNGQNATVGSLSGAGTIDNVAGAGSSTLTTGGLNANVAFSGVIKNTTGTVGITKVGTGNLTLSGTNTFTGNVTLTGGELAVSATANLGAANNTVNFNGGVLQVTGTTLTAPGRTITWSPNGGGFDITNAANTFTVSTALSGGGLIKRGPGAVVVSQPYNTTSPTTLTAGNLSLTAAGNTSGLISGAGNLTVSAGTQAAPGLTAAGIQVNALAITGAVQLAAGSPTSSTNSYTLAGAAGAWTASLDLNGNKLVVEDAVTKPTTLANLRDQVAFGKANAFGISSTGLPGNYGIAVVDNAVTQKTTFGTVPVDANSVLVAPEILGDANIDGHVDLTDLSTVLNNFGTATAAWTSGNFDGAATIDLTDLSAVLNNFGLTNPNATDVASGASPAIPTPEPASLVVLGFGAAALISQHSRRSRRSI